jgi:hypothetical protein
MSKRGPRAARRAGNRAAIALATVWLAERLAAAGTASPTKLTLAGLRPLPAPDRCRGSDG